MEKSKLENALRQIARLGDLAGRTEKSHEESCYGWCECYDYICADRAKIDLIVKAIVKAAGK